MSNRIDGPIDDIFNLLGIVEERNSHVAEPFRSILNSVSRRRIRCDFANHIGFNTFDCQECELEEKRLAQLERESGCNDQ